MQSSKRRVENILTLPLSSSFEPRERVEGRDETAMKSVSSSMHGDRSLYWAAQDHEVSQKVESFMSKGLICAPESIGIETAPIVVKDHRICQADSANQPLITEWGLPRLKSKSTGSRERI